MCVAAQWRRDDDGVDELNELPNESNHVQLYTGQKLAPKILLRTVTMVQSFDWIQMRLTLITNGRTKPWKDEIVFYGHSCVCPFACLK